MCWIFQGLVKTQDEFWHACSGETLNNQVFQVTVDDPKSMFMQVYCDVPQKTLYWKRLGQILTDLLVCYQQYCPCLEYRTSSV